MTINYHFHIEIPRRSACCLHKHEEFLPGMEFYSVLSMGLEKGHYLRSDYCAPCWNKLDMKALHPNLISCWKSKVPAKKLSSELPKKRDARALVLLKEALLHGHNQDEAFVLSLYLARRRLIVARQEIILNNSPATLYEVVENEEMLCVPRLSISELQVEKVQRSLAVQLKS